MTGRDEESGGKVRPSIGSVLIMTLLNIIAGVAKLFRIKSGSLGNMDAKEREAFSGMMDAMKQDMTKKDR